MLDSKRETRKEPGQHEKEPQRIPLEQRVEPFSPLERYDHRLWLLLLVILYLTIMGSIIVVPHH